MQSLSGQTLKRQQVPMMILLQFMSVLLFVFLKKLLWVHVGKRMCKGQRSSTNHKMLVFPGLVQAISEYVIFEWPLYEAPTPMVILLLLV